MALYSQSSPLAEIMPGIKRLGSTISQGLQKKQAQRVALMGGQSAPSQTAPSLSNINTIKTPQVPNNIDPLGGDMTAQSGGGGGIAPTVQQGQPNAQGVYPDGSLVPGSPAFKADLESYGNETARQDVMQDQREAQHPNLAQTEPYSLNKDLTVNQEAAPKQESPALGGDDYGDDYYANADIQPAFQRGVGGFNEMDKSKLVNEAGFPAYVDGQQVSAPLFDNTYMKKRYGSDVESPRTEEERVAEGRAVNERRDKHLSSLGGKGTIRQQQLGMAERQFEEGQKTAAASSVALGEQNRLTNELAKRKQSVEEFKALRPKFEQIQGETTDEFGNKTTAFTGAFNPATGKGTMLGGEQTKQQDINNLSKEDKLKLANMMNKAVENPQARNDVNSFLAAFNLDYESHLASTQTQR